jgi:hypothetical protein
VPPHRNRAGGEVVFPGEMVRHPPHDRVFDGMTEDEISDWKRRQQLR